MVLVPIKNSVERSKNIAVKLWALGAKVVRRVDWFGNMRCGSNVGRRSYRYKSAKRKNHKRNVPNGTKTLDIN